LIGPAPRLTLDLMSLLTLPSRVRRPRCSCAAQDSPLSTPLRNVVLLSADLLAALLEVEQRDRATLDDLEWADAVAARIVRREVERSRRQASCASTATTPRRRPSTARRAIDRSGSSATSAT
jgi:hypothetical protein